MLILVCNVGSTSLKYKLFNMPSPEILVEAKTERVGREDAIFSYRNNRNGFSEKLEGISVPDYAAGIRLFLKYLLGEGSGALDSIEQLEAIGFKTVLAKGYYGVHELTDEVIAAMEAYVDVAPAHNPPYIQAIRVFRSILPDRLMVGCFETAFHTTIPLSRRIYALPYEWYEQYGICRLGYHGASHGYISRQIRARAGEHFKLVSCHMGGSGSICAIQDGKSVDTSFGFSLQTGIPHANRSGDIDAYIQRPAGYPGGSRSGKRACRSCHRRFLRVRDPLHRRLLCRARRDGLSRLHGRHWGELRSRQREGLLPAFLSGGLL